MRWLFSYRTAALNLGLALGCSPATDVQHSAGDPAEVPLAETSPASAATGEFAIGEARGPLPVDGLFSGAGPVPAEFPPLSYDPATLSYDPTSLTPSLPLLGGTLAVTHDDKFAVAALPAADTVAFVDLDSLSHAFSVTTPPGSAPTRVVEDARGLLHIVLRGTDQLATIDPTQQNPIAIVHDACVEPRGISFDVASDEVVVACKPGELVWFDAGTLAVSSSEPLRRHFVDFDLRDIFATAEGLFVSVFRTAEVLKLSRAGKLLRRLRPNTVSARTGGGAFEPHVAHRSLLRRDGSLVVQHQRSSVDPLGGSGKIPSFSSSTVPFSDVSRASA